MELIIFRDAREVGRLRLSEGTFSIGRGLHNTIALDDHSISRRHARLHVREGHLSVQDLASINGTYLHKVPVTEADLQDGDVVTIGPFSLEVRLDDDDVIYHDRLDSTAPGTDPVRPEVSTHTHPVGVSSDAGGAFEIVAEPPTHNTLMRSIMAKAVADADAAEAAEAEAAAAEYADEDEDSDGAADDDDEGMHPHDFLGFSDDDFGDQTLRPAAPKAEPKAVPVTPVAAASAPIAPEPAPSKNEPSQASAPAPASAVQSGASLLNEGESAEFVFDEDALKLEADESAVKRPSPRLPKTIDLASGGAGKGAGGRAGVKPDPSAIIEAEAPRLVVRQGEATRPTIELPKRTIFIGRAEEMDVVLLDSNASRRHAAVAWEDGGYVVRDLWSLNGIKVNGQKVPHERLKSGDMVQVGDTVLEFIWPGEGGAFGVVPAAAAAPLPATKASELGAPAPSVRTTGGGKGAAAATSPAISVEPPAVGKSTGATSAVAAPSMAPPVTASSGIPGQTPSATPARAGAARSAKSAPLSRPLILGGAVVLAALLGGGLAVIKKSDSTPAAVVQPEAAIGGVSEVRVSTAENPLPSSTGAVAPVPATAPATDPVPSSPEGSDAAVTAPATGEGGPTVVSVPAVSAPAPSSTKTAPPAPEPAKPAAVAVASNPAVAPAPAPAPVTKPAAPTPAPASSKPVAVAPPASGATTPSSAVNNGRVAGVPVSVATAKPADPRKDAAAKDAAAKEAASKDPRADLEKRMQALYQSGVQAQKQAKYQEALKLFEAALKGDPSRESELYYQIEDEIQTTRARLQEQVRPMVSEATSLAESGQLSEARSRLLEAISKAPDYQPATQRLKQVEAELIKQGNKLLASAQAKENSGALAEAESLYKQVQALVSDRNHPLHQRASQALEQLKQRK